MFLGDGGSMLIGFLLGTSAMSAQAIAPGQRLGTSVMILVPFLPFGIPLFEVGLSVFRRWLRGQSIFLGDRDHLHHRVGDKIQNPRLTVAIFYLFSATFCALTLFLVLGLQSDLVKFLIVIASIVLFAGVIASIALYRVPSVSDTLRNRRHFKYLNSYLSSMKCKIEEARSIEDLIGLLESGISDLNFDNVEVSYDGRPAQRWSNPRNIHPDAVRRDSEATLGGGRLTVKWRRPIHHEEPYDEYLRMTWRRFLMALSDAPALSGSDPVASKQTSLSAIIGNEARLPFS
jgi:UDP-GlcNAc:undecaprenyl-phosphate GlcNAc-1-phosphate transferase